MAAAPDNVESIAEPTAERAVDVALAHPSAQCDDASICVIDDLPRPMPVAPKEVDVIETHLAALLDDLLGKLPAKNRTSLN